MLFRGKFKLTDRMLAVPDHLGSFFPVSASESRDGAGGSGTDSGEEMETFLRDAILGDHVVGGHSDDDDDEDLKLWEEDPRQDCKRVNHKASGKPCVDADESGPELESELSQKIIDLEALQKVASRGLPPGAGGARALVWKLLLGYLPGNRDLWDRILAEKRSAYLKLKSELILDPSRSTSNMEFPLASTTQDGRRVVDGQLERHVVPNGEHPLSLVKASVWHQYFQDSEITAQIDRDLLRTHPNIRFFAGESTFSLRNRESMRNILLLFAKLNPAIGYVQGMNEIVAPLYYVFSTDSDTQNAANAEADSFSCFVTLLSDSVDHFCPQLDNSPMGILSTLSDLSELLKANDEELWRHLELSNKVKPQFYAFRWITLLLTQEFEFQAVLRIWDSLLGSPFGVQEMALRVCCAMLMCARGELLDGDFAANLKLLQHYSCLELENLLRVAREKVVVPSTWGFRCKSETPLSSSGFFSSSTN
ncbi:hypothetical protein Taro_054569 [Colocasia esculenta]|uniref:Rab-GAP TBC domain-containing protein n=1 Tax=Colocasia esculenta TaxID=4460 RepID=A0A843XRL9_COLES|nr:hypothetical protein [Colocasia esculenta]